MPKQLCCIVLIINQDGLMFRTKVRAEMDITVFLNWRYKFQDTVNVWDNYLLNTKLRVTLQIRKLNCQIKVSYQLYWQQSIIVGVACTQWAE